MEADSLSLYLLTKHSDCLWTSFGCVKTAHSSKTAVIKPFLCGFLTL